MPKIKTQETSIDVDHIAKLANIPISQNEKDLLSKQLEETINYVQELEEIDTKNVAATSQVTELENVTREDIAAPSLPQKDALKNTKSVYKGFIVTNAILEEQ